MKQNTIKDSVKKLLLDVWLVPDYPGACVQTLCQSWALYYIRCSQEALAEFLCHSANRTPIITTTFKGRPWSVWQPVEMLQQACVNKASNTSVAQVPLARTILEAGKRRAGSNGVLGSTELHIGFAKPQEELHIVQAVFRINLQGTGVVFDGHSKLALGEGFLCLASSGGSREHRRKAAINAGRQVHQATRALVAVNAMEDIISRTQCSPQSQLVVGEVVVAEATEEQRLQVVLVRLEHRARLSHQVVEVHALPQHLRLEEAGLLPPSRALGSERRPWHPNGDQRAQWSQLWHLLAVGRMDEDHLVQPCRRVAGVPRLQELACLAEPLPGRLRGGQLLLGTGVLHSHLQHLGKVALCGLVAAGLAVKAAAVQEALEVGGVVGDRLVQVIERELMLAKLQVCRRPLGVPQRRAGVRI
eukprot:SM000178S03443  [mRNA]  locus=s178:37839:40794:+ [translate_table: standard]